MSLFKCNTLLLVFFKSLFNYIAHYWCLVCHFLPVNEKEVELTNWLVYMAILISRKWVLPSVCPSIPCDFLT